MPRAACGNEGTSPHEILFYSLFRRFNWWHSDSQRWVQSHSLQECRKEQMLKSFDRGCGTLYLGLKDRALQRRNEETGELIAVALA
jgi:hypothetical protein